MSQASRVSRFGEPDVHRPSRFGVRDAARSLRFAARSLRRQPGRASVGILGIAAVGALLFDMLLLSRGLVVSFRELLDSVGYDVRVLSSNAAPIGGPRVRDALTVARDLSALPEVDEAVPIWLADADASSRLPETDVKFSLMGMDPGRRRPWTVTDGSEPGARDDTERDAPGMLINRHLADRLGVSSGDALEVRVSCASDRAALPPVRFRISGIADFPFDNAVDLTAVASRASVLAACGEADSLGTAGVEGRSARGESGEADMILIASRDGYGPDAAVAAIRRAHPELHPATNEEIVARMQATGFSYFRQISTVLSTITLLFGFLLVTVLMTVSVNQRLAEIAAMRALGFSRVRVAADVLSQSALLVGIGGVLALPLGAALSIWLDRILKAMPGIPSALHFFVFEPRALVVHAALLGATALLAAVYPIRLVTTLPIAATLRNETVS